MDATLAISILAFVVALVAVAVSVYAIRRDAPALRITMADAAAGSRFLRIVNVGLRPVRVERMTVRPATWRRRWETPIPVPHSVLGGHFRPLNTLGEEYGRAGPVVVLQPGEDVLVQVGVMASQKAMAHGFAILVEDAAGREYGIRAAPRARLGPPGIDPESYQGE